MKKELLIVVEQLERERGIDKEKILLGIEQALETAAKKIAKITDNPEEAVVKIDRETGEIKASVGSIEITSAEFGRIAAQTARQVIMQKMKEAEKESIYDEFKEKEGQLVSGVVYRFEKKAVIVDLLRRAEGIIPMSHLTKLDKLQIGERIKAYVLEVKKEYKSQIILSRKAENFVKKLFELEVPEIYEGIVEIKAVAREPGERTKIAVYSKDDKVDAVGACVGIRGSRVKNIVSELRGEKIDIVRFSEDLKEFIKASLAPAVISRIDIDRERKRIKIIVGNDQLSLAIGKFGQNVRLASKLTGWELDVRSKEDLEKGKEELTKLKGIGKKTLEILIQAGFEDTKTLLKTSVEELSKIKGIGEKKAEKILEEIRKLREERIEIKKPEPQQAAPPIEVKLETGSGEESAEEKEEEKQEDHESA